MYTFLRHYVEMVIVMFVGMGVVMAIAGMPSGDTVALLYMGASMTTVDYDLLMGIEHVAMLLAMLGAMLYRRDEYTGHAHHRVA